MNHLPAAANPVLILGDDNYRIHLSATGTGYSSTQGWCTLTRDSADPVLDPLGFFIFLRDLDNGLIWSPTPRPLGQCAEVCGFAADSLAVTYSMRMSCIESVLEVSICPAENAELRRLRLHNVGERTCRMDVTGYLEPVIFPNAADACHPAFAKLFLQTAFDHERQVLLVSRRPRGHNEKFPWLVHGLSGPGEVQYETDRKRFIGRGRSSLAAAVALAEDTLAGTLGNVLDPVLSLRRRLSLAPAETADLVFYLGVAPERDAALALAERIASHLQQPWQPEAPPLAITTVAATPDAAPHSEAHRGSETAHRGWEAAPTATLRHWNGYGGFSADGSEYVILLAPDSAGRLQGPPLPWINVVANPTTGFLASETGAGYTWSRNSRQNRLTPWFNDPVLDPHGEAFYIRDEDACLYWSPLPGPVPGGAYEVRHGFGYSHYRHLSHGLEQETWQFVPLEDSVKITRIKISNRSGRPRRLSLFAYQQIVLGVLPEETRDVIVSEWHSNPGMLMARNLGTQAFVGRLSFAAYSGRPVNLHHCADRAGFIGDGNMTTPAALTQLNSLDGRTGNDLSPCFALQAVVELPADACLECAFLLGEAANQENALLLVSRYATPAAVAATLDAAQTFWRRTLSAVQIETPLPALDLMLNGWLAYQNLACRIWGRTAFYQSGGAYGYRDQLQDSAALIYLRPDLTRAQVLLHASHQFLEGDVLHWWHPAPMEMGLRTRFADDLLWLPYVTAYYIRAAGDWRLLDERAVYLTARSLELGEDEAYLKPENSGQWGNIYEHCCRAIDRSLSLGAHGLPLFGTGDWNDGMSRVGREGRGESVWMGFFLHSVLGEFLPVCQQQGDTLRMQRYQTHRDKLAVALNEAGWDGEWYRRAYYDDGVIMGSKDSDECQIDALAQAWAIISGTAPTMRANQAMDAVEKHLISDKDKIIRLLTPPFENTPHDPGYIKGYVKGVRENGGQYSHAACWVARAMIELGRYDRAAELLEMLSPVSHSSTPEDVAVYQVEPYVIAADVYGVEPHIGRGGWTWYTGSASWYYRVVLESLLGFELMGGEHIRLKPRIPASWPGFRLDYRLPDSETVYRIRVENVGGGGIASVVVDGQALAVGEDGAALIPLSRDEASHEVVIKQ